MLAIRHETQKDHPMPTYIQNRIRRKFHRTRRTRTCGISDSALGELATTTMSDLGQGGRDEHGVGLEGDRGLNPVDVGDGRHDN